MLYKLIYLNLNTYLVIGLLLPIVIILFWYLWCRERILLFGILASLFLTTLYAFAGSLILYSQSDPSILAVYGHINLINREKALSDYMASGFFRIENELSWKALSAINPDWKSNAEVQRTCNLELTRVLSKGTSTESKAVLDLFAIYLPAVLVYRHSKVDYSAQTRGNKIDQSAATLLDSEDPAISGQLPLKVQPLISTQKPKPPPRPNSDWVLFLPGELRLNMVWITPGNFQMGSPTNEPGRYDDETQHQVTFTVGYWLGKYEVTQVQWEAVMKHNPSSFKKIGKGAPVENVSWEDAMDFCKKLTAVEKTAGRLPAGYDFSLPTEAQWEYACRAGTTTRFYTGNYKGDLDRAGWYNENAGSTTHQVGRKQANAWGLYDMHGNVWEWCYDRYGDYPQDSVTDPTGAPSGTNRVRRGGSWDNDDKRCRVANRRRKNVDYRSNNLGFRLALRPIRR